MRSADARLNGLQVIDAQLYFFVDKKYIIELVPESEDLSLGRGTNTTTGRFGFIFS